jgi:hypothetical protein
MVIANRLLHYANNGRVVDVPITVSAPIQDNGPWFCEWTIEWPHGTRTARGYGVDSIQALRLTLEMIGAEIYASAYHASGHLYFEKPNDGYGFPVPQTMHDMVIGQDR